MQSKPIMVSNEPKRGIIFRSKLKINGIPPTNAPRAFPKLKAACMHEAPRSCPPSETFKIRFWKGADVANNRPPHRQISGIAKYAYGRSKEIDIRAVVEHKHQITDTLPGFSLSQSFPETRVNNTMQIPSTTMMKAIEFNGICVTFVKRGLR